MCSVSGWGRRACKTLSGPLVLQSDAAGLIWLVGYGAGRRLPLGSPPRSHGVLAPPVHRRPAGAGGHFVVSVPVTALARPC